MTCKQSPIVITMILTALTTLSAQHVFAQGNYGWQQPYQGGYTNPYLPRVPIPGYGVYQRYQTPYYQPSLPYRFERPVFPPHLYEYQGTISAIGGTTDMSGVHGQQGMAGMSAMSGKQRQQGMAGMSGMSGKQRQQGMAGMSGMSGKQGQHGMAGMSGSKEQVNFPLSNLSGRYRITPNGEVFLFPLNPPRSD